MDKILATKEWIEEANEIIHEALKGAASKLYKKHKEEVPFFMFLHVGLCGIMDKTYEAAPNDKDAERFINAAHELVKKARTVLVKEE